ncbi:hypothetical protein [uncultured Flavobacterium sp.]|uniref:hypothetical protein n=1 Tax=uncultured Flavobacterium sp. TaxID=165435 RepID=UPI0025FFC9E6|nr:hypothetical protein [uncultured Flavobacterium sp.]
MKNFLKISLIVAVFLSAFGASANEKDFSLKVKSEKGKTVSFSINEAKNINLSIYGKNNETLFDEKINSNGVFNRTYDLNAFPEGNYVLEVETDAKLAQYEIHISGGTASISEKAITEVFKPVLTKGDGFVTLNILKTDKNPVEVQVFDENNTELYSGVITNKSSIAKKFDTNTTGAEKLTFIVKYKDQIFSETIASR